jgi:O-antigen/teichoic acid export membrane protein
MREKINKIKGMINEIRTGDSLKNRSARGAIWLGGANGFEQGIRFLRNMILTRLIAPEAFGIMAIILAVNKIFESFTEVGIKQAIIQNPSGEDKTYLNGAWWLAFLRGSLLYTIGYFGAPALASFYEDPQLIPLVRVAFLTVLFRGILSPRAYVAIKEMKFFKWISINHLGGIIGIIATVIMAFYMRNVWALVIGFALQSIVRCLLSFIVCPFLPGLTFKKEHTQALVKYIMGILGLPILTFIFMRVDVFVIGKLCTKYDLGLYSMALTLAYIPQQIIASLISEVVLPAFSKIQEDYQRLNRSLIIITRMIAMVGFPMLFLMGLYGKEILFIVYGPEYAAVALPFALIATTALLTLCSTPIAGYYFAIGKPELHRYFTLIRAILILILIYPLVYYYGLIGAASAGAISMIVGYILQVGRINKLTSLNLLSYSRVILESILLSIPILIVWFLTHQYFQDNLLLNLIIGVISFLVTLLLSVFLYMNFKSSLLDPSILKIKRD